MGSKAACTFPSSRVTCGSKCHMSHAFLYGRLSLLFWGFPGGSVVKNLPANAGDRVWSLSWEDPLEKETATHSSILAWEIPRTEEPGALQSMGCKRVRHNLETKQQLFTVLYWINTVFASFHHIISFMPWRLHPSRLWTSLVAQTVKHLPTMREILVQSLGWLLLGKSGIPAPSALCLTALIMADFVPRVFISAGSKVSFSNTENKGHGCVLQWSALFQRLICSLLVGKGDPSYKNITDLWLPVWLNDYISWLGPSSKSTPNWVA